MRTDCDEARNVFHVAGRAAVSVSGGRTSGFLLWLVLQAHGGVLPPNVVPMFGNTGKEEEATLCFLRDITRHWGVPIVWVEFRAEPPGFAVVDFDSASRHGEPFEALIRKRNYLPNPVTRFCTSELKIRSMHRYLRTLGWLENDDGWDQLIGIRADEPRRIAKIRARGHSTESAKETMLMPLADAGMTVADVRDFWRVQPFDLGLPSDARGRTTGGNCDLCFLKPAAQLLSLIRERPARATWWARMEQQVAAGFSDKHTTDGWRFRKDRASYAQMAGYTEAQRQLFNVDEEAIACFCGD